MKKTIDADDQVAGRITNMQLTYNSVETWPDRKDWGFYGEVERHSITANIDPGLLTTRLSKVRDIKIVNGKYIGFDKVRNRFDACRRLGHLKLEPGLRLPLLCLSRKSVEGL